MLKIRERQYCIRESRLKLFQINHAIYISLIFTILLINIKYLYTRIRTQVRNWRFIIDFHYLLMFVKIFRPNSAQSPYVIDFQAV